MAITELYTLYGHEYKLKNAIHELWYRDLVIYRHSDRWTKITYKFNYSIKTIGSCCFSLKNTYVTCPCSQNSKYYNFRAKNNSEKIVKPPS